VVLAVRAQDLDLLPAQAGGDDEPVQRVALRLPAPDGGDARGDALARLVDVDRPVVRAEDAEVLRSRG